MKSKRFLSILLSLVMAVSVMSVFAANASAADVKKLQSGKTVSTSFKKIGDEQNYKIVTNKSGTLKLTFSSQVERVWVTVTDKNNKKLKPKAKDTLGTAEWNWFGEFTEVKWNKAEKKYTGTLTYEIDKGTYYINLSCQNTGDKKLKMVPAFPSADASSDVKINSFAVPMKVGDTLQLDTVLSSDSDDNVVWKSSKTAVAKVSATGLITAKSKGTAVITASIGESSMKIQVNVS